MTNADPNGTALVPNTPPATQNGLQVVVYSKPSGCIACTNTKRWLLEREIPFSVENILEPDYLLRAKTFGIASAPMVTVQPAGAPYAESEIVFSEFRPDVLEVQFPPADFPKTRSISPADIEAEAPVPPLRDLELEAVLTEEAA